LGADLLLDLLDLVTQATTHFVQVINADQGGGNPIDGLNYGLEFKTGTRMVAVFEQDADIAAVREAVTEAGYGDAVIQQIKTDGVGSKFQIQTDVLTPEESQRLQDALDQSFGGIAVFHRLLRRQDDQGQDRPVRDRAGLVRKENPFHFAC